MVALPGQSLISDYNAMFPRVSSSLCHSLSSNGGVTWS